MQAKPISSRMRASLACVGAAGTLLTATVAGASPVFAASNAAIQGQLQAYAAPGSYQIQQLFSGSDGQLWFVTPDSHLGEISSTGQATLTGVDLPHGGVPAVIAGAGSEGVWA